MSISFFCFDGSLASKMRCCKADVSNVFRQEHITLHHTVINRGGKEGNLFLMSRPNWRQVANFSSKFYKYIHLTPASFCWRLPGVSLSHYGDINSSKIVPSHIQSLLEGTIWSSKYLWSRTCARATTISLNTLWRGVSRAIEFSIMASGEYPPPPLFQNNC